MKTGTTIVTASVNVSLCRLCPWLKAFALVPAFGLKLICAPNSAQSLFSQTFNQAERPAGIIRLNGVKVRGKVFDRITRYWQRDRFAVKLNAFSESSYNNPVMKPI